MLAWTGALALAAYGVWLARGAYGIYRQIPSIPVRPPGAASPRVSIIVPARNEAHNLPDLLPALRAQDYPNYEVIVVDDASDDGTAEIAARAGARVIATSGPPPGWTGKCNACWQGAQAATGAWLLFVDADTTHQPRALASAMAWAEQHQADVVTMILHLRCVSFWERMLVPYAFQHLFAGVDPGRIVDPDNDEAVCNGQFILIRRDVYLESGGHAAVRGSIIEDLALGRHLKRSGYRLYGGRGDHLSSVRMYRDFAGVREGFGKNAYALLANSPAGGWKMGASATLGPLPALLTAAALLLRSRVGWPAAVLTALAMADFARWQAVTRSPRWLGLLQPLAALSFQSVSLASVWRSLSGAGLSWKGRRYVGINSGLAGAGS